jgi:hypothetical protein
MKNQLFASVPEGLEKRIHFYFCILVAMGLSRRQGRIRSSRQKNAFLMKWLKNAGEVVTFRQSVASEIAWLRQEILRNPPDRDPEPMLQRIWQTANEMSVGSNVLKNRS